MLNVCVNTIGVLVGRNKSLPAGYNQINPEVPDLASIILPDSRINEQGPLSILRLFYYIISIFRGVI